MTILSQMYLDNDSLIKAKYHALKALSINPDHNAPVELLNIINDLVKIILILIISINCFEFKR